MNDITEILSTFETGDLKNFRHFLNRQKQVSNRKSLEMLDLIIENPNLKPAVLAEKLYKTPNNEAYQAVRKTLKKQLVNFIVLKQFEEGSDAQQTVMGLLGLSRYLFDHRKNTRAWKFLLKAEKIALENELYDQLELIFMLQIEHAPEQTFFDISNILEKYEANRIHAERERKVAKALAIVKFKLHEVRISGNLIDFNSLLLQVMTEYQLQEDYLSHIKLFYQFMEIFRSSAIAHKDYYSFEPFILVNYKKFHENYRVAKKDLCYKAGILYMIAHTLYRNKKFKSSLLYLEELNGCFQSGKKASVAKYYIRSILMEANCRYYTGEALSAITLLENTIENNPALEHHDRLNLQLSLCFCYFFQKETSKANRLLFAINSNENKIVRWMGSEWALKKDMLEMIVQYDLENFDLVHNRIQSIISVYQKFLTQEPYVRIVKFLLLIQNTIENPGFLNEPAFYDKVENSFHWLPVEQEDTQAVLFYVWLKARMQNQPLYNCLIEMMAQAPQN